MALFAALGAAIVRGGQILLRSVGMRAAAGQGAKAASKTAAGTAARGATMPKSAQGVRAGLGAKPIPKTPPPAPRAVPKPKAGEALPLSDKWKKMSVAEKFGELQKAGQVAELTKSISKPSGIPGIGGPSREQVIEAAEEKAEKEASEAKEARDKNIKSLTTATIVLGGFTFATIKASSILKTFVENTLEGSRGLRRFNASINNTFARLDRQNIRLAARQAQATSGSTARLGREWKKLKDEMQPIREMVGSLVNLVGLGVVESLRGILLIVKMTNKYLPFLRMLQKIAEAQTDKDKQTISEYAEFLKDVKDGKWGGPKIP